MGYVLYVLSLKRIPVALTALIESGNLFAYLIIDSICGYLEINIWFCFLFALFVFSIFLFSVDTYKFKESIKNKEIRLSGIFILLLSMFFYGLEPYLIKFASNTGANEIAINFGYYIFAIPFFFLMYLKNKDNKSKTKSDNLNLIKMILLISIFESFYELFGTIGYINEIAVINAIIQEIRVFLLFILSIFAGTDKLTFKKSIAIFIGILSTIVIYLY